MKDKLIDENNDTLKYVVMVNGQPVSPSYTTPQGAEQAIQQLSEAHQEIAEVVPVTGDGKQLLLD